MDILTAVLCVFAGMGFLFCACVGFGEVMKTIKECIAEYKKMKGAKRMIKWKYMLLIASIVGLYQVFWTYSQGLGIEAIAVCASSSLLFFLAFVYLDLKKGA